MALVLGGTVPHRHLVQLLKTRGFWVILIDYLRNPPAAELADQHIRVSTLDREAVLEIARDCNADLVLSPSVDQANVTAAYCCEKLGISTTVPYSSIELLANKAFQKSLLNQAGVPTAPSEIVRRLEFEKIAWRRKLALNFPLIVKPVDSNGSKGVSIVSKSADFLAACRSAKKESRTGELIVEELNIGPEFNFYFMLENFEPRLIFSKVKVPIVGSGSSLFAPLSVAEPLLTPAHERNILCVARKISSSAKLEAGPLMIQASLVADGHFRVIEFAARLGGGLSTLEIQRITGLDLLESSLNHYGTFPWNASKKRQKKHAVSCVLHIYAGGSPVANVVGLEELGKKGEFREHHFHQPLNTENRSGLESRNRVLALLGTFSRLVDAKSAVEALKTQLYLLSANKENLLRTDLLELDWGSVARFFPAEEGGCEVD